MRGGGAAGAGESGDRAANEPRQAGVRTRARGSGEGKNKKKETKGGGPSSPPPPPASPPPLTALRVSGLPDAGASLAVGAEAQGMKRMGQSAARTLPLLLAGLLGEALGGFPNTISVGKRPPRSAPSPPDRREPVRGEREGKGPAPLRCPPLAGARGGGGARAARTAPGGGDGVYVLRNLPWRQRRIPRGAQCHRAVPCIVAPCPKPGPGEPWGSGQLLRGAGAVPRRCLPEHPFPRPRCRSRRP